MIKDRSKYYKEPMEFLGQKLYQSDLINKIDNEHWKNFGDAATKDSRLKVGDFIVDFENIYKIYDEKDGFFFYHHLEGDKATSTSSLPKANLVKSGFRHLQTKEDIKERISPSDFILINDFNEGDGG